MNDARSEPFDAKVTLPRDDPAWPLQSSENRSKVRSIAEKLHLAGVWWEIAQHGGYPIIPQTLIFHQICMRHTRPGLELPP